MLKQRRIQVKLERFVTREELTRLHALADMRKRTVSELIREAIEPLLEHDGKAAGSQREERISTYKRGGR